MKLNDRIKLPEKEKKKKNPNKFYQHSNRKILGMWTLEKFGKSQQLYLAN
jgi:hypothetical protein